MKIENDPKKDKKKKDNGSKGSDQPQGIELAGRFIPYTWLIYGGCGLFALLLFMMLMGGGEENGEDTPTEPETEEVEGVDEPEEQPEEDADSDRMWDEYIDEDADIETEEENESSEDEDASEESASEDESEETADVQHENEEEMAETIENFLVAYQIYSAPGRNEAERAEDMSQYGTEDVVNTLLPDRGEDAGEESIDVVYEFVEARTDKSEGVDNEYTTTFVYTREIMGQTTEFTDVYRMRTDGEQVTEAQLMNSIWN